MARMNWDKAKRYSGYEMKYDPGKVLSNGYVVPGVRSVGEDYLATRDDRKLASTPKSGENWASLKSFVAAAGLKVSEIMGGNQGVKIVAMEIYGLTSDTAVTEAIKKISKPQRRAKCKRYRKAHGLLHPKQKGILAKRDREKDEHRLQAIQEQLKVRE